MLSGGSGAGEAEDDMGTADRRVSCKGCRHDHQGTKFVNLRLRDGCHVTVVTASTSTTDLLSMEATCIARTKAFSIGKELIPSHEFLARSLFLAKIKNYKKIPHERSPLPFSVSRIIISSSFPSSYVMNDILFTTHLHRSPEICGGIGKFVQFSQQENKSIVSHL